MQAKAKGALAIGTVAVVITYAASGFRSDMPTGATSRAPVPEVSAPAASDYQDCHSVTVFYATDRALGLSANSGRQQDLCLAGVAAVLGLAAFAVWFAQRRQRKAAITSGGVAAALAIGLLMLMLPGWIAGRGIRQAYESGRCYGTGRGDLERGFCEVTIPLSHRTGQVESPSILRLELQVRADRHVMLQRVIPQGDEEFYQAVRERVQASPQRDLFVFVHGFNVSFESAARRTGQIAHDLDFAGAPIFFSWPSQGKAWRYTVDETNVTWAVPHLKQFLTELSIHSDAQSIHLIAHSMGNRALTQAIRELGLECQQDRRLFQQVILAAPDIDADVFRDQIAPSLARYSSRVTLYASANDEALAASKLVHGSQRAGEAASSPLTAPGIETIDVAMTELGPLGHSYYGSCPLILQDLGAILRDSRPASQRPWLASINSRGAVYWRLTDAPKLSNAPAPLPPLVR